jgi:hypothetical protein
MYLNISGEGGGEASTRNWWTRLVMVEKKNGGKLESSFFGCAPFFWVFFF